MTADPSTTDQPPPSIGVREYLVRFGYLNPRADGVDALAKALWGFQRLHRLPLTGVPDVMTIGTMQQHRCGHPDLDELPPHPRLWSVGQLVCEVANAPGGLTLGEARGACAAAVRCWQPHVPFEMSMGRGGGEATVTVRYVAGDHGDGFTVGSSTGVVGHAFMLEGRGARLIGEIHLDIHARWAVATDANSGSLDLVAALAHHLGHIFGLGHAMIRGTVMHPVARWGQREPARQDLSALRALQASRRSPWQRLIDRLRLR